MGVMINMKVIFLAMHVDMFYGMFTYNILPVIQWLIVAKYGCNSSDIYSGIVYRIKWVRTLH
jgi:hypothetical protein